MPAVKVSVQAMMLQMAAAKQWGPGQLRQARSAHRRHVAAGRHNRPAERIG